MCNTSSNKNEQLITNNKDIHNNQPNKIKVNNIDNKQKNNKHVYKLGQKPNSFKKFKKNLKKQNEGNEEKEKNLINNEEIFNIKMNNKNTENINTKPINNDYEHENKIDNLISSKSDTLIRNEIDEFEMFRMKIISDVSIDEDIKKILIQSRKEQMDKFESKTKNNIVNAFRSGIVSILIVRLRNENYVNINGKQKNT